VVPEQNGFCVVFDVDRHLFWCIILDDGEPVDDVHLPVVRRCLPDDDPILPVPLMEGEWAPRTRAGMPTSGKFVVLQNFGLFQV
jgi:hypothetical protein